MTLFLVLKVEKNHNLNIYSMTKSINLTWADGMEGVCCVFSNKSQAIEYCGDEKYVVELNTVN